MAFSVERDSSSRESFGPYWYLIYEDGCLIARFWHDYRGDDNGIVFTSGAEENNPLGSRADFIGGGGPQPLVLTKQAIKYLESK
ncbi:hypothetical protein [Rhodoferax sp.]|uniref:hypothetical protein n=1 Tax=Rhodoferax sp. TaxID=50421 RepID=UPI00260CBC32|nr:hypothetical protein [Rhodoferax sp.]MDD2926391.1 hypothetical protein [Rhodoferax sp.]